MSKVIETTKADFAENFLFLNGNQLSLDDYPHLRAIYNSNASEAVFMFSRQTAKSTTLANLMITNSVMNNYFKSLYIAPTVDQTKVFSHDRVNPVLEGSPLIKEHYMNSSLVQNVFMKQLLNGSRMYLRYALLSADRIRGYCQSQVFEYATLRGWISVKDLTKDDKILTLNKLTKELEYQKPTEIIVENYEGPMHVYKSRGFKLEVTPEHRLHVSQQKQPHRGNPYWDSWHTELRAKDAHETNLRMGLDEGAFYKDSSPEYFYLSEFITNRKADGTPYRNGETRTFKEIKFPIKEFMTFMGWWLAEGWTALDKCNIGVAQDKKHNPEYWQEIKNIFDKLFPEKYVISKDGINFSLNGEWRTLYEYLKPLGKSGDKHIPRELLNYTKYLPDLLDALYKGDGDSISVQKPNQKKYLRLNTKSEQLANTVQEAWLRLGKLSSIRHRDRQYGRIYTVEVKAKNYFNFLLTRYKNPKKNGQGGTEEIINYKGKIYCVVVPNGNFVTRHKEEKMPVLTGNSADMNIFDEVQDLRDEIIPVVQETMTRSMFKWSLYAGTPKRSKGTLATIWDRSTRNEYIIKCQACSHWNILGPDNIGDHGVVCGKCGRPMNVREGGQWVSTYSLTQPPKLEGFRVCLLHFDKAPWVNWEKDVLGKREKYSTSKFHNEVLALEYDEGTSPITEADLIRNCRADYQMTGYPNDLDVSYKSIMGVDYGPINSDNSHTVITIMQKRGDRYHVLYIKKFLGKEADYSYIHKIIPELMERWKVVHLAADYGMGEAPNSEIRNKLGYNRVIAFQHLPTQKEKIRWNPKMPAYTLSRNQVMNEFFQAIRNNKVVFPRWDDFEPFKDDFLNVQMDFDEEKNNMKFTSIGPDDAAHSTLYAQVALDLMHGIANFS